MTTDTAHTCAHEQKTDLRTRCFAGALGDNRAAHGGITVTVECNACGARRDENRNGKHVEVGPWGPSRAARQLEADTAKRAVQDLLKTRPDPVTLKNDNATVRVAVNHDGMISFDLVEGDFRIDQRFAVAEASGLLPYAKDLRAAVLLAEDASSRV